MSIMDNVYRDLSPQEAEGVVKEAEARLADMDLPQGLTKGMLVSVQTAIAQRNRQGMAIDYCSREEVVGLVSAAMGGYDHLTAARLALNRYVSGIVQSGEDIESLLVLSQTGYGSQDTNGATET